MNETEKEYLYLLCRTKGIGAVTIRKLWETFRSFETIYYIEETGMIQQYPYLQKTVDWISQGRKKKEKLLEEYHRLSDHGIQFITPFEEEYPSRLKEIYDYPMGLMVKGRLPEKKIPMVSIVGARQNTEYGRKLGEWYGKELAKAGVGVISGMAKGIDGEAHWGAFQGGGWTGAVLGNGVEICYPRENAELYKKLKQQGCLISEYGPWDPPAMGNFPMRNRIISGMADAVVIVEARERSGSLITASLALEQGREVLAVPGRVTDPCSKGCNQLIRQGAVPTFSPADVLEYLKIQSAEIGQIKEKSGKGLAKKEKMVYSCLDLQPKFLDEIAIQSGLEARECMMILLELELKGYVVRTGNQHYGKKL